MLIAVCVRCGEAEYTLTGLSVTSLAGHIDASLYSFCFCERKEPARLPDNAQQGNQYGRKGTQSVTIQFVFIGRNVHSVPFY
jgi:hypothetical protein